MLDSLRRASHSRSVSREVRREQDEETDPQRKSDGDAKDEAKAQAVNVKGQNEGPYSLSFGDAGGLLSLK